MKRCLLFILIFSNLSFSQELTSEDIAKGLEKMLEVNEDKKTLVCSGSRNYTITINNEPIPEDNEESFTEYVYLLNHNVLIRKDGELEILGILNEDGWSNVLEIETFKMSDASINFTRTMDENFYKENPEVEKFIGDLEKTKWREELSIDRYTGKFTHTYEQGWKSEEKSVVATRNDRLEGMCKLAGKQQF